MHGTVADIWNGLGLIAQGVIVTLLVMSVLSLGVVVERAFTYERNARRSRRYALEVSPLLRGGRLRDAVALANHEALRGGHLTLVLSAGLQEWLYQRERGRLTAGAGGSPQVPGDAPETSDWDPDWAGEATRKALQHATSVILADLRRGLALLATIGSTAPFVGLFGTTFGIINAFSGMALTGSGGITTISAGISEALITTAFGLFVAVPAIWAYNFFLGRIDGFGVELERGSHQLLDHLTRTAA